MQYDVLIYHDPASGLYIAEVPDLPGCMTQGATVDDAKANVREAIEGHLATLRDLGRDVPQPSRHLLASIDVDVA